MKTHIFVCASAALSMGLSGVAWAQNRTDVPENQWPLPKDARQQQREWAQYPDRARQQLPVERPAERAAERPLDRRGDIRNDDRRGDYRIGDDRRGDYRGRDDRRDNYRRGDAYPQDGRRDGGDYRHFRRGERLSGEYRNRQYMVDDWRGHRLSAPPRGYQWFQTGPDYLLVAIATGVIVQVLVNY